MNRDHSVGIDTWDDLIEAEKILKTRILKIIKR